MTLASNIMRRMIDDDNAETVFRTVDIRPSAVSCSDGGTADEGKQAEQKRRRLTRFVDDIRRADDLSNVA